MNNLATILYLNYLEWLSLISTVNLRVSFSRLMGQGKLSSIVLA